MTEDSFETLRRFPKNHQNAKKLLNSLIFGYWEKGSIADEQPIKIWQHPEKKNKYLYSFKLDDDYFAIWEPLWSVDFANRLKYPDLSEKEMGIDFSPHIILYSINDFLGQPDSVLRLTNVDYQYIGEMKEQYLEIYDRKPGDEIRYNRELLLLAPSRINSVLKGEQKGLPLHMTKEQVDILSTHRNIRGPILLSGEAGSGKTVIITHWLVINRLIEETHSQLFVTFSDRLTEQTKEMFEQMLPPDTTHDVRFLTYRDLLLEIAEAGGINIKNPNTEMTFERFTREYSHRVRQKVDLILLWDEIRSVIKGGCKDPLKRMIDFSTYEELSERRGRCKTPKKLRADYYKEAQLYQNYLDEEGMWDSIDLAFDCLQCVDKTKYFEKIACDEVQDLAPVEIRVLLNLVKDKKIENIFFTGDTAQVINPSGFQWSKLKGDLGTISNRRDIRDKWELHRNFRSTKEIVDLVNEVIRIREKILDDESERNIQESNISHDIKPMVLESSPLEVIKKAISSSKQRLILVKTKKQKLQIQQMLKQKSDIEKPTILTVEEAKGLEWDGVLLWNFFIPRHEIITKNDWENIFIPSKRKSFPTLIGLGKKDPYGLTYEFNLLHVGLTRARDYLFIYDQDQKTNIRNLGESILPYIQVVKPEELYTEKWSTTPPTPEELIELAQKLLGRDRDQAFQFFRIAASEFEKKGNLDSAAKCFSKAYEYGEAARCYEKLRNYVMQKKTLALGSELKNNWAEAGKFWEEYCDHLLEEERLDDALQGYKNATNAYSNGKKIQKSAKSMERRAQALKSIKELSYIIEKAISMKSASRYWKESRSWEDAIRTIKSAINIIRDEIIKKDEKIQIDRKNPREWVAECLNELSGLYIKGKDKKYLEAAQYSVEAAGYFKKASESVSEKRERMNFLYKQVETLSHAVDLYKSSKKIDVAIDLQVNIVDIIKKNSTTRYELYDLDKEWEKLIKLLRGNSLISEYINETIEFVKYQRKKERKDKGYGVLEEQINWCKLNNYSEQAIELLKNKLKFHEGDEEPTRVAKVLDEIGDLQDNIGMRRDAISSYIEAGKNYLRIDLLKSALTSFDKGKNIAYAEMTPTSVGWYCFKDVAIDFLVLKFEEKVKQWVENAVESFVQEYKQSVGRIEGLIKIYNEKLLRSITLSEKYDLKFIKDNNVIEFVKMNYKDMKSSLTKQQLNDIDEKAKVLGWSWLTLAILHQKAIRTRVTPLGERKKMDTAFQMGIECFTSINENDLKLFVERKERGAQRSIEV